MTDAIAAAAPRLPPAQLEPLRRQAQELEAVFLTTLTKQMFTAVETEDASFGGGFAEETWRGMQAEQMASAMAAAGGIGLADAILSDLLMLQEAASDLPTTTPKGAYQ